MRNIFRLCAGAACASLSLFAFGPALAQEEDTVVQGDRLTDYEVAYVAYRDLNFANAKGEKILRLRIHRAATNLCVPNGIATLSSMSKGWACRKESIKRAEPQVVSVLERYQNREVAALGSLRGSASVRIEIRTAK